MQYINVFIWKIFKSSKDTFSVVPSFLRVRVNLVCRQIGLDWIA